jgi:PAS domain S-box-containing protein
MKRLLTMALVAVALAISVSAWAYLSGSRTVTAQARELSSALEAASVGNELTGGPATRKPDPVAPFVQHVHSWAKKITFANAAAGIVLAALMLIGAAAWQRQTPEPPRRFGIDNPAVQQLHFEVANHLKERRRLEFELNQLKTDFDKRLEERTAAVSATYTKLEAELNQRKQSEKTLSQQRQELERSKDVLELHVQARTAELQKLQRRYEHILNSAGEGIYGLDMTGKTTFVNPAAAKLTGYTVEELLGKTEQQTVLRTAGETELTRSRPQPSDTQHTRSTDTTTIVGRDGLTPPSPNPQPSTANSQLAAGSGEHTFRRKDGSAILVEYTRTLIVENGKQMGAVVTFKDITERKRAEETLARKAAELARSNAELEQFAYVASHDLQEPLRKIRAFGDRLKSTIDQLTAAQAPGTKRQTPDTGNTQHRRRKKSAETQTITRAEASDSQPSTPNPQLPDAATAAKDYMQRMQNAAARMQTLINDLLTFSRVISTTQPFALVDLAAVTREVLNDLEVRIQQTGAKIEVGDLPTIDADHMQMRQLLQNIIANALKFQPVGAQSARAEAPGPGAATSETQTPNASAQGDGQTSGADSGQHAGAHVPQIKITAQLIDDPLPGIGPHASGLCELSIRDNGIGFDEKYTDKIFAMFQRLHGRSEYEGTGVGLAVCRRITDRHSGTISAHSKPGEGATFVVRLPVHQVNKPLAGADNLPSPSGCGTESSAHRTRPSGAGAEGQTSTQTQPA